MVEERISDDYPVGSRLYYNEMGAVVEVEVIGRNFSNPLLDKYRLKLIDVFIPGPGFQQKNIGDEFEISGGNRGMGGVYLFEKDDKYLPLRWINAINTSKASRN